MPERVRPPFRLQRFGLPGFQRGGKRFGPRLAEVVHVLHPEREVAVPVAAIREAETEARLLAGFQDVDRIASLHGKIDRLGLGLPLNEPDGMNYESGRDLLPVRVFAVQPLKREVKRADRPLRRREGFRQVDLQRPAAFRNFDQRGLKEVLHRVGLLFVGVGENGADRRTPGQTLRFKNEFHRLVHPARDVEFMLDEPAAGYRVGNEDLPVAELKIVLSPAVRLAVKLASIVRDDWSRGVHHRRFPLFGCHRRDGFDRQTEEPDLAVLDLFLVADHHRVHDRRHIDDFIRFFNPPRARRSVGPNGPVHLEESAFEEIGLGGELEDLAFRVSKTDVESTDCAARWRPESRMNLRLPESRK